MFNKPTDVVSLLIPVMAALIFLGLTFFHMELSVRRFHDIGRKGTWSWALFLPLAGLYFLVLLCFRHGDSDDNAYGPKPYDDGTAYTTPLIIALIALPLFSFLKFSNLTYKPYQKSFTPAFTVNEIALQDRLSKEPCRAQTAYDLSQSYLKTEKYQAAIELEKDFHVRCPKKVVQLQWAAFESAKELQDFPLAESMIASLIAQEPKDADYYIWRGRMFENRGLGAKAAVDYEEAIRLKPKLLSYPLNLVEIYRHLGNHCQALETHLRYSRAYPEIMKAEESKTLRKSLEDDCKTRA